MLQYGKSWYEFGELPDKLHFTTFMYQDLWNMKPEHKKMIMNYL